MDAGDTHGAMARAAIAGAPRWARDGAMARGGWSVGLVAATWRADARLDDAAGDACVE